MKHRISGFTMLELIVVVAILAILLSMAVPAFKKLTDKNHLKGAAEVFYNKLQLAKSEAILRNRDIFVSVKKDTNWCMGMTDKNTCDCSVTPANCTINDQTRVLSYTEFKNITLDSNSTMTDFTIKSIRGLPTENSTATFINPDNLYISVILSALGRVRVCSNPNDSNPQGIPGYPIDC